MAEGQKEETPETFLAGVAKRLSEREGVDIGLADILKAHLLKESPAQDSVAQAKAAILKLASERASPPKHLNAHG